MARSQTNPAQDWRDGFLFLGNQLALDFLNTRPVLDGVPTELLPDFNILLRWFKAAGLIASGDMARLEREWTDVKRMQHVLLEMQEFRETLRRAVIHWEESGTVAQATIADINRLLADHPMRTRMKVSQRRSQIEQYFNLAQPEDLFAPIASSAAALFAGVDHRRVRKCAQCVLHFQDTSKKGTRRWCSMQLCGNRQKVAAYAARQRRTR
ncbi:MAG TPA: ABATE domain-containing protein [Terriglobales bacterium]|nr:ABATE domain-containing protein [Terriglobales bacterium]